MSNPTGAATETYTNEHNKAGEASSSAAGDTSGGVSSSKAGEASSSTASSFNKNGGNRPEATKGEKLSDLQWQTVVMAILNRDIVKLTPHYDRIVRAIRGFVDPDPFDSTFIKLDKSKEDLEFLKRNYEESLRCKER